MCIISMIIDLTPSSELLRVAVHHVLYSKTGFQSFVIVGPTPRSRPRVLESFATVRRSPQTLKRLGGLQAFLAKLQHVQYSEYYSFYANVDVGGSAPSSVIHLRHSLLITLAQCLGV